MLAKASHVARLQEDLFNETAQELRVDEVPVSAMATQYGTPLYIYSRSVLDQKWAVLRDAFPEQFAISYSVKANPNRSILQYFINKGAGLEVASGGELCQALGAGCPPSQIVFAGPGKTETELEFAIGRGVGEIHAESMLELQRISTISRRLGLRSRVALRVNPSKSVQGGAMRMGGKPAPFGIDEEYLESVLSWLESQSWVEFHGIHLFMGTQILDHTVLLDQYRHGMEIARNVASKIERPLRTLDFGGGLGIPYFPHEKNLDMGELGRGLEELTAEFRDEWFFSGTQFMIEPGRFLVGEAGVYVAKVNDIKTSRGRKFLIVDGGMHHHLAASGNLGQAIKRNFPMAILNKLNSVPMEIVDVVGPLCTPLDSLARDMELPKAEVGDLIGVFQSGAYARTASPLEFLSHPAPPEIWVEEGKDHLIRQRGKNEDYLVDAYCVSGTDSV